MSCSLKTMPKDYCLNSSATAGSDNSLTPLTPEEKTPLTSERAKLEYKKNTYSKKSYFLSKCFFVFRCYISEIY